MQTIPESETALLLRTGEEPTPDALSGHEKVVVALVIEGTCPDRTPGSGCCEAHWGGAQYLVLHCHAGGVSLQCSHPETV